MSACKLICYFLNHPVALGFRASSPPDNIITLNPALSRLISLSDFQIGIGASANATLDTEQHISGTRTTLEDTTASL